MLSDANDSRKFLKITHNLPWFRPVVVHKFSCPRSAAYAVQITRDKFSAYHITFCLRTMDGIFR